MSGRTLADDVISLYPHNWNEEHNYVRIRTMEMQLDRLTGSDFARYNAILDAIEGHDYLKFCALVRGVSRLTEEPK